MRFFNEWKYVILYLIHVCGHQLFFQPNNKRLPVKNFVIELQGTLGKMREAQWHIVTDIPFKVIPVTPFYAILPSPINQSVYLTGKQIRQSKAACHKRVWLQQKSLLSPEIQRRLSVDLNLYLDRLICLK